MKSLLLIIGTLLSGIAFGEVVKFDTDKTVLQHIHKTKNTIIYIGEDWCPACQRAKKILSKAAVDHADKLHIVFLETDKMPANATLKSGSKDLNDKLNAAKFIPNFVVAEKGKISFVGTKDILKIVKELLHP